ncbi:DUF1304 domain-containing protein [Psittacicella hinzii]|uniref:DUF1304 domain-containing protein n=1 Tax=Psittacicella hinzii TaxID=2028575 RepID=A0A3A1YTM8_9GAMM|nr:DUF1304 family protein [Psittacicella hinzii]RIY40599.1 hypothetical protein CKF58_00320 [Psittacicella hinzii]
MFLSHTYFWLVIILLTATVLEFVFIFVIETVIPRSALTRRVFNLDPELQAQPLVQNLLKNQGVYNLVLAVFLIISVWSMSVLFTVLSLGVMIAVAIYGALTVNKHILWKQGLLPALSLSVLILGAL